MKNKKTKKLLSVLLCVLMTVTLFPVSLFTANAASVEDLTFELNYDDVSYMVDKCSETAAGELVIPSEYNGMPVTAIDENAFVNCGGLTSVVIPDTVTDIGEGAFENCAALATIDVPDTLTRIGTGAFHSTAWYNAQEDGVVYLEKYAYCYKGKMPAGYALELNDDTLGIADFAFGYFKNLAEVTIPESVTNIGRYAFTDCTGLIVVGFFAAECADVGMYYSVFNGCSLLSGIKIGDNVKRLPDFLFKSCTALEEIVVSTENQYYCSSDGVLFNKDMTEILRCPAKKAGKYTIRDYVTNIGVSAFENCTALTEVKIPETVTAIGDNAFNGCTSLTAAAIPDSVTSIGDCVFKNTAWYDSQPDGVVYAGKFACAFKGAVSVDTVIELTDGTKGIAYKAFYGMMAISTITIPASVEYIGGYSLHNTAWFNAQESGTVYAGKVAYAYKGTMPQDTGIVLADGTKGIADCAFFKYDTLTSVEIPESVTNIGSYAFCGCAGLKEVSVSATVTSIGRCAFGYYYDFKTDDYLKYDGFTVYCAPESAAEIYASVNGFTFKTFKPVLTNLDVKTEPTKTEYHVGDAFDAEGLTLTATYSDGTSETVTSGFTCTPEKMMLCGEQTITVTYGEKNCTFYVNVNPAPVEHITPEDGSEVHLDAANGLITGMKPGATAETLTSQLTGTGYTVKDKDGKAVASDKKLGTGMILELEKDGEVVDSVTVVVLGDIDGDAGITTTDAREALRSAAQLNALSAAQLSAGKVTTDTPEKLTTSDARRLLRVAAELERI